MSPQRVVLSQKKLEVTLGDRWSEAELAKAVAMLAADGRFPAGIRGLPPELIKAIQRERAIEAMIAAVVQLGYSEVTVKDVLARARISRPTFYEVFEDKEDCFIAAFDSSARQLREVLFEGTGKPGQRWQDRLRNGIASLLRFIAEEPDPAGLVIVASRSSSPAGLRRRDDVLDEIATCIDSMVRDELPRPPSAVAAAGVVGGIESVLYSRMQKSGGEDLDSLLPALTYFAVLTYAGREGAQKEMEGAFA